MLISLVGGSVLTTYSQFVADGPLTERTDVVIPKGKSLRELARHLKEQGVVHSSSVFELGARAGGNAAKLKAGEYSIPPKASAKIVMMILVNGQTVVRRFIVPEGFTSRQVVDLMDGMYGLMGSVDAIPAEGTLLPDTYHYSYGDTRQSLIDRMQAGMSRILAEAWAARDPKIILKTPYQAVTLASIVEKETGLDSERARIAAVFYNRLRQKIRLQSDPTVIYGLTKGKTDLKRKLTYADLRKNNPYNTYVIYGLPQGPICNPSAASLRAVLNPIRTSDVYFVADGKGGHTFSATYREHQANVQTWRSVRRDRDALTELQKVGKAKSLPVPKHAPDGFRELPDAALAVMETPEEPAEPAAAPSP
ncbi:MAG: endolytic transglycosylase MltG [Alphaproteobacteria bacterium]|nr:endolytic transglycosylase MltG [Alphaproteobacteria bacterium]